MNIKIKYLSALLLCDVLCSCFGVGLVCLECVSELSVDYTCVLRLC